MRWPYISLEPDSAFYLKSSCVSRVLFRTGLYMSFKFLETLTFFLKTAASLLLQNKFDSIGPRRKADVHAVCDRCFADPQTGVAPGVTRGRNVRSRYRCSMCPAIHINSRT